MFLHYVPRYLYSTFLLKLNCWIFINSETDEIQTFLFSQILFLIEVLCRTLVFKVYILFISQHKFAYFLFVLFHIFIKDNRMAHTKSCQWKLNALYLFSATSVHNLPFGLMELNHLYYFYSKENLNQCKLLRKFSAIFKKKCLMTIIS